MNQFKYLIPGDLVGEKDIKWLCNYDFSVPLEVSMNYGNCDKNEKEHYLCLICRRKYDLNTAQIIED